MTIKQNGGIFGRNPTFNNLDVDGLSNFNNTVRIARSTGTLLELYDADGGWAASTFSVTNGGRDMTIFAPQDIIFTQEGLETARFLDGGGLTFNGNTAAANALDDYEEGTWTPTIIGGTTAGSGTYSQQDGVYTKVGNLVTVSCYLAFTAHTGTGHMKISGLPFAGIGSSVDFQAGATQAQYVNAGTGATQLCASVVTTASDISLYGFVNSAAKVATQVNASSSGSQLAITLTYRTT